MDREHYDQTLRSVEADWSQEEKSYESDASSSSDEEEWTAVLPTPQMDDCTRAMTVMHSYDRNDGTAYLVPGPFGDIEWVELVGWAQIAVGCMGPLCLFPDQVSTPCVLSRGSFICLLNSITVHHYIDFTDPLDRCFRLPVLEFNDSLVESRYTELPLESRPYSRSFGTSTVTSIWLGHQFLMLAHALAVDPSETTEAAFRSAKADLLLALGALPDRTKWHTTYLFSLHFLGTDLLRLLRNNSTKSARRSFVGVPGGAKSKKKKREVKKPPVPTPEEGDGKKKKGKVAVPPVPTPQVDGKKPDQPRPKKNRPLAGKIKRGTPVPPQPQPSGPLDDSCPEGASAPKPPDSGGVDPADTKQESEGTSVPKPPSAGGADPAGTSLDSEGASALKPPDSGGAAPAGTKQGSSASAQKPPIPGGTESGGSSQIKSPSLKPKARKPAAEPAAPEKTGPKGEPSKANKSRSGRKKFGTRRGGNAVKSALVSDLQQMAGELDAMREIAREKSLVCFRCCEPGHRSTECTVKEPVPGSKHSKMLCMKCRKPGHFAADCRSVVDAPPPPPVPVPIATETSDATDHSSEFVSKALDTMCTGLNWRTDTKNYISVDYVRSEDPAWMSSSSPWRILSYIKSLARGFWGLDKGDSIRARLARFVFWILRIKSYARKWRIERLGGLVHSVSTVDRFHDPTDKRLDYLAVGKPKHENPEYAFYKVTPVRVVKPGLLKYLWNFFTSSRIEYAEEIDMRRPTLPLSVVSRMMLKQSITARITPNVSSDSAKNAILLGITKMASVNHDYNSVERSSMASGASDDVATRTIDAALTFRQHLVEERVLREGTRRLLNMERNPGPGEFSFSADFKAECASDLK